MRDLLSRGLYQALASGDLVVTGNERAARSLRAAWDTAQAGLGHGIWVPANVFSWQSWIQLLWRRLLLDGRAHELLMTPQQEQMVWTQSLESLPGAPSLRSAESLAKLAKAAWSRLCQFSGEDLLDKMSSSLQGDTGRFAQWAKSFQQMCGSAALLSEPLLERELSQRLDLRDTMVAGGRMLLVGCTPLTPAQAGLLVRLQALGTTIFYAEEPAPQRVQLIEAEDETGELRACARWLRDRLRVDPQQRLAVIVSDLGTELARMDSVLREHLAPQLLQSAGSRETAPYEFSLGLPLAQEPLITAALNLLEWAVQPLPLDRLSSLLLSPHFAAEQQEFLARAELDTTVLRRKSRLRPQLSIAGLLHEMRSGNKAAPRLTGLTHTLANMERMQRRMRSHSAGFAEWAEWMRSWLETADWARQTGGTSSRIYQLHERWEATLDQLATLDFLGTTVTFEAALLRLRELSEEVVFAPETRDAPVQILGPLEAAGQTFDAVWVLRSGESSWPPMPTANPLLAWALQREREMPGVDREQDRRHADELTWRLAGSAPLAIFSYARVRADSTRQREASAVARLLPTRHDVIELAGNEAQIQRVALEEVHEAEISEPVPHVVQKDGSRILELQAACGFRAFAEVRLGSAEAPERSFGFSAGERGSVVHKALQCFWDAVRSQDHLLALSPVEIENALRDSAAAALSAARKEDASSWDAAYLEVQHTRLINLLRAWLTVERARPGFTVLSRETHSDVAIGPLRLSLRLDRIDDVDGRQVIIDYKTGHAATADWLGDRPDSPQVPLYAVLASQGQIGESGVGPLGGLAFGLVQPGKKMSLPGFEAAPGVLYGADQSKRPARMAAASFEEQLTEWQQILEQLASDFVRGDLRVRPKQFPTTCKYCRQQMLCRVDAAFFEHREEAAPGQTAEDAHAGPD